MFLAPQGNAYSDRRVHLSDIKVIMVVANSYMECDQVAPRNLRINLHLACPGKG